jgi:PncC family amidohydrolase
MKREVLEVVEKVHETFKINGYTLSVAESCTGGLISHYLTSLAGASSFLTTGIVSYSEEAKKSILGVSSGTIRKHGVVSEETAREMAEKMRLLSKSDFSVSVTGNLGPDVLEGKDKGLVYIAASKESKTVSRELRLEDNRNANKEDASLAALKLLIELAEREFNQNNSDIKK